MTNIHGFVTYKLLDAGRTKQGLSYLLSSYLILKGGKQPELGEVSGLHSLSFLFLATAFVVVPLQKLQFFLSYFDLTLVLVKNLKAYVFLFHTAGRLEGIVQRSLNLNSLILVFDDLFLIILSVQCNKHLSKKLVYIA